MGDILIEALVSSMKLAITISINKYTLKLPLKFIFVI